MTVLEKLKTLADNFDIIILTKNSDDLIKISNILNKEKEFDSIAIHRFKEFFEE